MRHRPELDGLRAVAVLAVVASHTGATITLGGWTGVDVFFVLSGYLITALLLEEHDRFGRVDLGRFYARRALRLYPALVVLLLLGAGFHRTLGDGATVAGYLRSAAAAGLYVQDFVLGFTHTSPGGFGHTWSLAVEEQFYLVWPVAFVLLVRWRRDPLGWVLVGIVAGWVSLTLSLRTSPEAVPYASYFLPWNRFPQLLVGCASAILLARHGAPRWVGRASFGATAVVAGVATTACAAFLPRYPHLPWQAPAIALSTAALLWHLSADSPSVWRRVLSIRPAVWLGRRSYGVYLFHAPVLLVLETHLPWRRSVTAVVMVVVTLVLAALSYRVVELPFLRRKPRVRPREAQPPVGAALTPAAPAARGI